VGLWLLLPLTRYLSSCRGLVAGPVSFQGDRRRMECLQLAAATGLALRAVCEGQTASAVCCLRSAVCELRGLAVQPVRSAFFAAADCFQCRVRCGPRLRLYLELGCPSGECVTCSPGRPVTALRSRRSGLAGKTRCVQGRGGRDGLGQGTSWGRCSGGREGHEG
jgi:Zn ribbon nucleic-acid-binding protein